MIKTRSLFLDLFFAPETDMIFEDGVGPPYCHLDVGLCDVDVSLGRA